MILPAMGGVLRSSTSQAVARALETAGVPYVVLGATEIESRFLVAPRHLDAFAGAARAEGLEEGSGRRRNSSTWHRPSEAGSGAKVTVLTDLLYGEGVEWLSTGVPTARVLGHGRAETDVRVAAPQDELVDALLHCVVDLGEFPPDYRNRIDSLMGELRDDPVSGGRAAERVQQELAPALTWGSVVAAITQGRWEAILARRRSLLLQALTRSPRRSVFQWLSSRFAPPRGRGLATGADGEAGSRSVSTMADRGASSRATEADSRKHVRGSGLLLSGRGLSTGIKFLSELLIVRYLATAEYGSWTYALSVVVFLKGITAMGMHRAVARFLPMHIERGESDAFVGVLAFVVGTLLAASLGVVMAFYAFPEAIAGLAGAAAGQSLDVLLIMVFLVPVDALDDLLTNVCAAFANSRAIFVRRYVLSPGLRVAVALLLVALQADVRLLAYGYLLSGLAGVAYYGGSVLTEVRRAGLLTTPARLRLPVRRVLSYTLPVMGADICTILMITTSPLLLGYFADTNEVALFQVVVPLVALSGVVAQSFGLLFEPAVSRLHARGDLDGLDSLYWRSAVWVAVLSFPAFAIPFAAAEPLTSFLFGERYAAAAPILSLLAVGTFADNGFGFNNATLRVLGQVRWLLGVNILGAALNVTLNLILIPRMGALGAAIATSSAFAATAVMKQVALRLVTGVRAFDPRYASVYISMAVTAVALVFVRLAWPAGPTSVVAAVVGTLVVLVHARRDLCINETFPELRRWPALARLMG